MQGEKAGVGTLQQVQFTRPHERLRAALHVKLAVEVVDVALDRADRDDQPVGDRLIGVTIGDQPQDFSFTFAERLDQH